MKQILSKPIKRIWNKCWSISRSIS